MTEQPGATAVNRLSWWIAAATFALGAAISTWLWHDEQRDVQRLQQTRFDYRVEAIKAALATRMNACEQVLRGGAGLVHTLGQPSRGQWHEYVNQLNLARTLPGVHGVGYAEYVRVADLEDYVRRIRGQGLLDFAIRPTGVRPEYAPVTYLEPNTERNLRAHGFDMLSDPTRRAAMLEARDSGRPAISGKLKLASEADQSSVAGFLLYLPVYGQGLPLDTPTQRQVAIRGFVNSPLRMTDLLQGVLGDRRDQIGLRIYDDTLTQAEALMYDDGAMGLSTGSSPGQLTATVPFAVHGRTWTLQFTSQPGFHAISGAILPRLMLGGGLGMSALLASVAGLYAARLTLARQEQARFERLARSDALTGLANRAQFNQRLAQVLAVAQRENRRAALIFVDLDNLKAVNDHDGHDAGDALLVAAARRLSDSARLSDVVSRLGGDEFTVLLPSIRDHADVAVVAERILAAFALPLDWNGTPMALSASLGIAVYPDDHSDGASLLRQADAAMYRAKALGRRQFQFHALPDGVCPLPPGAAGTA